MAKSQEVMLTLEADVVERLLRDPLVRRTGYIETEPYPLSDFLNDQIRKVPTEAECYEYHYKVMIRAGKQLKYPGYDELYDEEFRR
jgi:hypothetical protein